MVEIGGWPILWHIMKIYSTYGINDFIICLGYKGWFIKEYFANYFLRSSDVTIDLSLNSTEIHAVAAEPWRVTLVDTGEDSQTGGRLRRIRRYLGNDTFCFTYGDGLADINLDRLLAFHRSHRLPATVTATIAAARWGALQIQGDRVVGFQEKPPGDGNWINGGFFVLEPRVLDYIADDSTIWERDPLERLAANGELAVYKHHGFWQPMDTLRERLKLEELWVARTAPWKVW